MYVHICWFDFPLEKKEKKNKKEKRKKLLENIAKLVRKKYTRGYFRSIQLRIMIS